MSFRFARAHEQVSRGVRLARRSKRASLVLGLIFGVASLLPASGAWHQIQAAVSRGEKAEARGDRAGFQEAAKAIQELFPQAFRELLPQNEAGAREGLDLFGSLVDHSLRNDGADPRIGFANLKESLWALLETEAPKKSRRRALRRLDRTLGELGTAPGLSLDEARGILEDFEEETRSRFSGAPLVVQAHARLRVLFARLKTATQEELVFRAQLKARARRLFAAVQEKVDQGENPRDRAELWKVASKIEAWE